MHRMVAHAAVCVAAIVMLSNLASSEPAKPGPQHAVESSAPSAKANIVVPAAANTLRYVKTFEASYSEYNTTTCKYEDHGTWTVTKQPKEGQIATDTYPGPSPTCPGQTFTYAAIYYTWNPTGPHNNKVVTDTFNAMWSTKDGVFHPEFTFNIVVPIVRPTGETVQFTGWQEARGLFMQKLTPPTSDPSFDFSGETVQETQAGAPSDTCWNGPPFPSANLTIHQWVVQPGNMWGPDGVGWGNEFTDCPVYFYRCLRRTPCGFSLKQQMQISSPADNGAFVNYGGVNTLASNIDGFVIPFTSINPGNITSERSGIKAGPRGYSSSPYACSRIKATVPACK